MPSSRSADSSLKAHRHERKVDTGLPDPRGDPQGAARLVARSPLDHHRAGQLVAGTRVDFLPLQQHGQPPAAGRGRQHPGRRRRQRAGVRRLAPAATRRHRDRGPERSGGGRPHAARRCDRRHSRQLREELRRLEARAGSPRCRQLEPELAAQSAARARRLAALQRGDRQPPPDRARHQSGRRHGGAGRRHRGLELATAGGADPRLHPAVRDDLGIHRRHGDLDRLDRRRARTRLVRSAARQPGATNGDRRRQVAGRHADRPAHRADHGRPAVRDVPATAAPGSRYPLPSRRT